MGARRGNKFGWHSGTLLCKDGKFLGDLYVQDDIVFSDVSAGTLGVTGGIDMSGTTSAIGIQLTGISASTAAIAIGSATGTRQTMAEAEDFAIAIFTTCADTDGSNTAKPLYVNAQYTGIGQVGRAAEFVLYPTAKMGGWANALKGYANFEGDSDGGTTGLCSAVCAEIKLPNGSCAGAFYPLEIEWVGQGSTSFGTPGTGSQSGLIYINCTGTVGDLDDDGVFMSLNGLTAGANDLLSANSQTLKVDLDNGSTTRYLLLSQITDALSLDSCATAITLGDNVSSVGIQIGDVPTGILLDGDFTDAISIKAEENVDNGIKIDSESTKTITAGINLTGSGVITTALKIDVDGTTGMDITSSFSGANAIAINGTASSGGLYIVGDCTNGVVIAAQTTSGIHISGATVTGLLLSGATTTGFNITGNATTAINVGTGTFATGLSLAGTLTTGINIGTSTTGIEFSGTVTEGIVFNSSTFVAGSSGAISSRALTIGDRDTEFTIPFAGSDGVENFEPIQMVTNVTGTNPASVSKINMIYQQLTHDTTDMANLRLKCADFTISVAKNAQDVYAYQGEISFSGTSTISGEAAVVGFTMNCGSGTLTGTVYGGLFAMQGTSTPAGSSSAIFLSARTDSMTLTNAIYIEPVTNATITNAIYINEAGTVTNFVKFAATGSAIVASDNAMTTQNTSHAIRIAVGGSTYYIPVFDTSNWS